MGWRPWCRAGQRGRSKSCPPNFPVLRCRCSSRLRTGCVGISVGARVAVLKGAQRREGFRRIARINAGRVEVERHGGARIDLLFIFGRNMNKQSPLIGRRIALIGCGTIGSHLAKFLVQSGAGHEGGTLVLLDNQSFEPGNVGRHYLGMARVGEWKAEARETGNAAPICRGACPGGESGCRSVPCEPHRV